MVTNKGLLQRSSIEEEKGRNRSSLEARKNIARVGFGGTRMSDRQFLWLCGWAQTRKSRGKGC
jgi:hypothetical protein